MLSKQKSPLLAVSRIRKLEPRLPTALEGLPITLRDTWIGAAGTRFELRPIEASDFPLLESFARRLSFRTRYFRFGRGSFELGADQIRRLCNPDPAYSVHLIVINEAKAQPSIVGFGRIVYEPGEKQSELTLTVIGVFPFCAHAEPIVVTIASYPPAYMTACPECGATEPKQLPGVPVEVAVDARNRRFGMDH